MNVNLKCKICGGDVIPKGKTYGICDSCGNEVTLPDVEEDNYRSLYNRANQSRMKGHYDRAYAGYEHILAENPKDAEAHWCLVLCRYGVEYVQNSTTGEYLPTISRVDYAPILEDADYLAALNYSDSHSAGIYRREAERIDSILKRYAQIARNEAPYDVFICYKATDDVTGQRTQDSVIAQDIYEELTSRGLKVFFARISLADKIGEAYEPYIFAALNSAKVMLLVATQKEYLESRWVKNEWSRYVSIMGRDSSCHIIPVYRGMNPYDFPMEVPMYQGADMGQIGALHDLAENVQRLVGNQNIIKKSRESVSPADQNRLRQLKAAEIQEKIGDSFPAYLERQLLDKFPGVHDTYQKLCQDVCRGEGKYTEKIILPTIAAVIVVLFVIYIQVALKSMGERFSLDEAIKPLIEAFVCAAFVFLAFLNKRRSIFRILLVAGSFLMPILILGSVTYNITSHEEEWVFMRMLMGNCVILLLIVAAWMCRLVLGIRYRKKCKEKTLFYEQQVHPFELQLHKKLKEEFRQASGVENWFGFEGLEHWDGRPESLVKGMEENDNSEM